MIGAIAGVMTVAAAKALTDTLLSLSRLDAYRTL